MKGLYRLKDDLIKKYNVETRRKRRFTDYSVN